MKIFILHPGKASYPEIAAYKSFFSSTYEVEDGTIADYAMVNNKKEIVLWCIMGYYPNKLPAKYVIHDYRSLSVGKLAKFKDFIKKKFSPLPDLRIFQNAAIQNIMGFNDKIPDIILPMGIPDWLLDMAPKSKTHSEKYCYIGVINKERRIDTVIKSFLKNTPVEEKFILVGPADKEILARFGKEPRLTFTGSVSQADATAIVSQCEYAICKIPEKYPYCYQMPTKFLEYASLDKIIICNDSASNRMAHQAINSKVIFTGDDIFDDNSRFNSAISINSCGISKYDLTWPRIISNSGICSFL